MIISNLYKFCTKTCSLLSICNLHPINEVSKLLVPISNCSFQNYKTDCFKMRIPKGIIIKLDKQILIPHFSHHKRNFAKGISIEETAPVTVTEIKKFLNLNNIGFEQGYTCLILNCPICTHQVVKKDKLNSLTINMTSGMFICYRCKRSGNWQTFQDYFEIMQTQKKRGKLKFELPEMNNDWLDKQQMTKRAQNLWSQTLPLDTLSQLEYEHFIKEFQLEGLKFESFKKYGIHIDQDRKSFAIPWYSIDGSILGMKKIQLNAESEVQEEFYPRPDFGSLFGWNTIHKNHLEVVLTLNEFHALAVNQEAKVPTLSLLKGSILPQEALSSLEQFKKIIIWFGNDVLSWETAKRVAKKLNEKRCYFIRPKDEQPNALRALQLNLNLTSILKNATPICHRSITSFRSLRQDVAAELLHAEQVAGIRWKRFPLLNKLLKGHRRGELTIFTGPTGSGKTTFMSEYSLDLCIQGINTLWGSFEIRNVRLAKMMLIQYAQISLENNITQYDGWADKFEQLPMYFMTFHGQESVKAVIDAMSHAVYVHDIEHIIVDNLQFMMGTSFDTSLDRFWRQDIIIATFRKFASTTNCHVTLVMHPRKEKDTDDLQTASIFGGAKATQEADNVLILQDKRLNTLRGRKYLQVTKNRFDGDIGIMPLEFDKETLSFAYKRKVKKNPERTHFEPEKSLEDSSVTDDER